MYISIVFILSVALIIVPHFIFSQELTIEKTNQQESQQNEASQNISEITVASNNKPTKSDTSDLPTKKDQNIEDTTSTKTQKSNEEISDLAVAADNKKTKSDASDLPTKKDQNIEDRTSTNAQKSDAELNKTPQEITHKPEQEKTTSSIPTQPEPVEEEKVVPEQKDEKPVGIDTVSLENPQGNWLFKKIWWERAEERYEKIRLLVDSIWNSRTEFFIKRNNLERNILEPFYITIGIDQSELKAILSGHIKLLEKQRNQDTEISDEERTLYEKIAAEEETLKQLERDVETIVNLDHHIDNALQTLMEQINRVRDFETQAWKNFKEIAHTLNDAKARELYYMIEGTSRNIKNISLYLERDFTGYFNRLIDNTRKIIIQVQNQIETLKEKGVYLTRQTEESDQQENQKNSNNDEEDINSTPKVKVGWFDWILSRVKNIFYSIFSVIRIPYDLLFGK